MNDVLVESLADNGNGSYAHIDNLEEAQKLFVEALTSTLQVIALDATPALADGAREIQGISILTWSLTTA